MDLLLTLLRGKVGGSELSNSVLLIGGVDVHTIPRDVLCERIAVLPATPVIFPVSVRSNIDPSGKYTDGEIWCVLETLRIKDWVSALPLQLDEQLVPSWTNEVRPEYSALHMERLQVLLCCNNTVCRYVVGRFYCVACVAGVECGAGCPPETCHCVVLCRGRHLLPCGDGDQHEVRWVP